MLDNLSERIKSAMTSIEDAVKVPEPVKDYRMSICDACEHLIPYTKNCTKCGCFMAVKTWLPAARCPINKWGRHSKDIIHEGKYINYVDGEIETNMSLAELEKIKTAVEASNNQNPRQLEMLEKAIQHLKNK